MGSLCGSNQKQQKQSKDYIVISNQPKLNPKIHTDVTLETTMSAQHLRLNSQKKRRNLSTIPCSEKSTVTSLNNSRMENTQNKNQDQHSFKTEERYLSPSNENLADGNTKRNWKQESMKIDTKAAKFKKAQSKESQSPVKSQKKQIQFQKILIGLNNSTTSNNCFINTILQCLIHTQQLTQYFLENQYIIEMNKKSKLHGSLAESYGKLVKIAYNAAEGTVINPKEIKNLIGKYAPHFTTYEQHDCQEFLRFFLDALHDDLNRIKIQPDFKEIEPSTPDLTRTANKWIQYSLERDDSIICDLFRGQLQSNVKCKNCNFEINNFESFFDLSLPIPKINQVDLSDCFKEFTKPETIEFKCQRCANVNKNTKYLKI